MNIFIELFTFEKQKIKKKRLGLAQFFKRHCHYTCGIIFIKILNVLFVQKRKIDVRNRRLKGTYSRFNLPRFESRVQHQSLFLLTM